VQRDTAGKRTIHNALDGFCPVELREKEKWVAGRSDLRASYQGQVYRFSSEAAKRRFAAAPEKYAPANAGYDTVLAMEENRDVNGSIQHSAVWQGRLYLFASSANLAAFREDPTRYAKRAMASNEANAVAEKRAAAESKTVKQPQKAEEPQKLRLPGDSL
jgi:YHS domain-containing protein